MTIGLESCKRWRRLEIINKTKTGDAVAAGLGERIGDRRGRPARYPVRPASSRRFGQEVRDLAACGESRGFGLAPARSSFVH